MHFSRLAVMALVGLLASCERAADDTETQTPTDDRAAVGRALAPVPLDLRGEDRATVELGSYFVNAASACVDCHSCPTYEGQSPFFGGSGALSAAHYLGGGVPFGPGLVAPGLTPDLDGNPGGLTEEGFFAAMRTGRSPQDPSRLLVVMPWPLYRYLTDEDIHAMYAYLRAIPYAEPGICAGPGQ